MAKLDFSLPNMNFIGKVLIGMLIIIFAVKLTPDTWGIKRFFSV